MASILDMCCCEMHNPAWSAKCSHVMKSAIASQSACLYFDRALQRIHNWLLTTQTTFMIDFFPFKLDKQMPARELSIFHLLLLMLFISSCNNPQGTTGKHPRCLPLNIYYLHNTIKPSPWLWNCLFCLSFYPTSIFSFFVISFISLRISLAKWQYSLYHTESFLLQLKGNLGLESHPSPNIIWP